MYDRKTAIDKIRDLNNGNEIFNKTLNVLEKYHLYYITKPMKQELYNIGFIPRSRYIKTLEDRKYLFSSYQIEIIDNKLIIGLSQTNKYNSNWLEYELDNK